jgi:hypothetical protein
MKSYEHLITAGPWIHAWPTSRAGKLRPGTGGGGGGDGGAADMEADRQARVKAAIDKINSIFNGADQQVATGQASSYNPGQTYYNADGSVYVAPTKTTQQAIPGTGSANAGSGAPTPAPNVYATGGDAGNSYYDPKHDPALGSWVSQGGDAGTVWVPNPGVTRQSSGGDADATTGYTRPVTGIDMSAVNGALKNGLYTGVKTVKGLDRQGLYDEQQQAVTDLNERDVNRQSTDTERQNRFGLARAGLSGGSADVDSNAEIDRMQNEGLMKAVGIGQQAGADLRNEDERTRQSLISMAQSGIDTGQMQQLALSGLDANAANASSARAGATVGNVFGDLTNAYLTNQQLAAFQNGYSPYSSTSYGSASARNGGDKGQLS